MRDSDGFPKIINIVGLNDNELWENIFTKTFDINHGQALTDILISSNIKKYSYYRLIIEKSYKPYVILKRFILNGYEEGKIKSNFDNLLANISNKTPYAYFRATDFIEGNGNIPAKIGTFTAETLGVTLSDGSGNGADAVIPFLYGNTNSRVNFKVNIPTKFTICSITRYTGNTNSRIIGAEQDNWFHGHWNNVRGVAYYGKFMIDKFNRDPGTNFGNGAMTNWLIMCGKNDSESPKNILADNNKVGRDSGGIGNLSNLNINTNEPSDFAFSQVLIWDSVLTDDEMQKVSNYLTQYLKDGLD
jgi:hypothetical protein